MKRCNQITFEYRILIFDQLLAWHPTSDYWWHLPHFSYSTGYCYIAYIQNYWQQCYRILVSGVTNHF